MKVNVSVEATAQEMREFLGLPNIQPLHDDILQKIRDNMQRGVINFDALGLMKPLLPTHFNSMEMVQKFWEIVAKASSRNQANDPADPKVEPTPDSDNDSIRNGADKA